MIAIREKHIRSARYLWQLFVYTINMFFLLLVAGFLRCCYLLRDLESQNYLLRLLTAEPGVSLYSASYAYTAAWCFLFLGVFIFFPLTRYVGYDMENRAGTRKLLFSIGYRRLAVVRYEAAYLLFDFLIALIAGGILIILCWQAVRQAGVVQAFLAAMETEVFLDPLTFFLTGAITLGTAFLLVGVKVRRL